MGLVPSRHRSHSNIYLPGGQFNDNGLCRPCSSLCEDRWGDSYCTGKKTRCNLASQPGSASPCPLSGPSSGECVSRCGVYVENGRPVPILSGTGLYVEDEDHSQVFLMRQAAISLVTRDTADFNSVMLHATYLCEGVVQMYGEGGK